MAHRHSSSSSKGKQPAYPEERNRDEGRRSGAKEKRSEKDDRLSLDGANNGPSSSSNNNNSGGDKIGNGGNANGNGGKGTGGSSNVHGTGGHGGKGTSSGGSMDDFLNNVKIPKKKKQKVHDAIPDPAIQNLVHAPYVPVPIPPPVKAPFVQPPIHNPPPPPHYNNYNPHPPRHYPQHNNPPPPPPAAANNPFEISHEDPMLPKIRFPQPPAQFLPREPVEAPFYTELTEPDVIAAAQQFADAAQSMLYEALKDDIMQDQCKPLREYVVHWYKVENKHAEVDENDLKYWPLALFCNLIRIRYDASGKSVEQKASYFLDLRNKTIHCKGISSDLNKLMTEASNKLQFFSKELRVLVPTDIAKVLQPIMYKAVTITTDDVVVKEVKEVKKEVVHLQDAINEINSKILLLEKNQENTNNNLEELKKQMNVIFELILELLRKDKGK